MANSNPSNDQKIQSAFASLDPQEVNQTTAVNLDNRDSGDNLVAHNNDPMIKPLFGGRPPEDGGSHLKSDIA